MAVGIKYLDDILNEYLTKEELSKFRSLVESNKFSEKTFQVDPGEAVSADIKKFLKAQHSFLNINEDRIEFLLTFSKKNLSPDKLYEMILRIGEIFIARSEFDFALKVLFFLVRESDNNSSYEVQKADAYYLIQQIYYLQAEWVLSIKYIRMAKRIFVRYKRKRNISRCESALGIVEGEKGNLDKAKYYFNKSLSGYDEANDKRFIASAYLNLGHINNVQGNYKVALEFYKKALKKLEVLKFTEAIVSARLGISMIYYWTGKAFIALDEIDKCIILSKRNGSKRFLSISYINKAAAYIKIKDYIRANKFTDKAVEIFSLLNDRVGIADGYKLKGIIKRDTSKEELSLYNKNFEIAENYFLTSLRMTRELENISNEAEINIELGILYLKAGISKEARKSLISAYKYYKRIGNKIKLKEIEDLMI